MYTVYQLIAKRQSYFGYTADISKRLSVHRSRFNNGCKYNVYKVFRDLVESFDDISVYQLKSFRTKAAAIKYENSLICSYQCINSKRSIG